MRNLTARQAELLRFVLDYTLEHLYQPTTLEMGKALGVTSTNGVNQHLFYIARKGYIELAAGYSRRIVFTQKALRWHFGETFNGLLRGGGACPEDP